MEIQIYAITLNKQIVYIGQTKCSLQRRMQYHLEAVAEGRNSPLYQAIKKYGIDKFDIVRIDGVEWFGSVKKVNGKTYVCDFPSHYHKDMADYLENYYIEKYKTHINHNNGGYNKRLNSMDLNKILLSASIQEDNQ